MPSSMSIPHLCWDVCGAVVGSAPHSEPVPPVQGPRPTVVHDPGHQALAGAGFALEQERRHGGVAWCIEAHQVLELRP